MSCHRWALVLSVMAGLSLSSPAAAQRLAHQKGARPKQPQAQLPSDVALSEPLLPARRSVAGGPTQLQLAAGAQDPHLAELRAADQVLFPEPVRGLETNWTFPLAELPAHAGRNQGLPLTLSEHQLENQPSHDVAWLKSLTMPDFPVRLDRRVVTYLKFYRDNPRGRTIAAIWTKKSGRYISEMKAQFRRAGLPSDLVWLSMIESGHNPTIVSPAGAVGLWQFMAASGRMYGLTVDRWVDERRDPARATQAAVRFLSDLYQRFGNWELAMGAYNMGYAGMSRAVEKYNTNDYWALSRMESGIPWETTLYVPKIVALAIVMNNRAAFGVQNTKLEEKVSFDTVLVEPATSLAAVAQAGSVDVGRLIELNPQYLVARVPPKSKNHSARFLVRVPAGLGPKVASGLKQSTPQQHGGTYVTKMGDTTALIARGFGVSEDSLVKQNALSHGEVLSPRTVLILPRGARAVTPPDALPEEVVVSRALSPTNGKRRVFYRVVANEDLLSIADAFSVTKQDMLRWNVLAPDARLRPGMTLQVVVDSKDPLRNVRALDEKDAIVLVAGSQAFHEHFEALKGKRRVEIVAKKGDSLAKLGARYAMSVGSMERVNRRSRRTELVPGEVLVVYTDKPVPQAYQAGGAEPLPELVATRPQALPKLRR